MLTTDVLKQEMLTSEQHEMRLYQKLTRSSFESVQKPLKDLYDEMFAKTKGLQEISAQAIRSSPRIIKMLRHTATQTISQMRLGQLADIRSTNDFEEKGKVPTLEQAEKWASIFRSELDMDRFTWLSRKLEYKEREIAEYFAKGWTVSLISNQNTATDYRNKRKEIQESAIADALSECSMRRLTTPMSGIAGLSSIPPGHFVSEQKILTGKKQKADLSARPNGWDRLLCIEAKAVGIRIDSTKRVKELNDKETDWSHSAKFPISTAGVCAGFFSFKELVATIRLRGILIFWEHNLDELKAFVTKKTYYGDKWSPGYGRELFKDVPTAALEEKMAEIKEAS